MALAPTPFALGSFGNAVSITPGTTVLRPPPTALWIGGSGTLSVVMAGNGSTVTLSVGASTTAPLPLCVSQVLSISGTATGIVGLW